MSRYDIKRGIAVVGDSGSDLIIMDETGRKRITSPLISALLGLMEEGVCSEDLLVAMLEDRFSPEEVYYALIILEKQGFIISDTERSESPEELFRAKVCAGEGMGYPRTGPASISVSILAASETCGHADSLALSLARSEVLQVKRIDDWHEADSSTVYVLVVPDYLTPEMEVFGRFAFERGIRFIPVKPVGAIPWMGPLFVPKETGCMECLLDRVRGHRHLETKLIGRDRKKGPPYLSVGQTVHSLEPVWGTVAVELEKMAFGRIPEITGTVFTFDYRTLSLVRHPLTKRSQCRLCGTGPEKNPGAGIVPEEPLKLQSQMKADYRDGGERVCSAVETLEKYAHLVSPITGVVRGLAQVDDVPSCFGTVVKSDWIVLNGDDAMADEQNGRLVATGFSTGKGRSGPQARASALGEAVERYCSQYEGSEYYIRDSFSQLGDVATHPNDLMGFSERQYRDREIWRQKKGVTFVPDPYDVDRNIDWTPAWSLTHRQWKFVPSAFVYYSYPRDGGGDVCRGCSNGVAAGNCLEEAIMQGFYELVERDATAMWWYHRLRKAPVDWRGFDSPFTTSVEAAMREKKMGLEILDLTSDLGLPVFSANLFNMNDDGHFVSIGLGCHGDPRIALERAVAELGQCLRLSGKDRESSAFQRSSHSRESFLRADRCQTPRGPLDFTIHCHGDFLDDIEEAVQMLREKGLEMLIVDLTRPDVGFFVARVIVPGMVHFWPRFGCRRLFDVPRTAGWIEGDVGEDDLNPVPFFL